MDCGRCFLTEQVRNWKRRYVMKLLPDRIDFVGCRDQEQLDRCLDFSKSWDQRTAEPFAVAAAAEAVVVAEEDEEGRFD